MDEKNGMQPEEDAQPRENVKTPWQLQKESWYDKLPLTVKTLDIIIGVSLVLLALTFFLIYLDARDIFHLFG